MTKDINIVYTDCMQSPIENIISIIDLCISICMLIIAIIGVICVYSYRKHQKEAVYGFYTNIQTFLIAFQLYIHSSTEAPIEWMKILGKKEEDITDAERKSMEPVVKFCSAFFGFLSTATNQIPPSRKKSDIRKWEDSFIILRTRLADIINYDLQAYPKWEGAELTTTCQELNDSVKTILDLIKEYKI